MEVTLKLHLFLLVSTTLIHTQELKEAKIGQFPYVVLIYSSFERDAPPQICTGSLIETSVIITSGKCMRRDKSTLRESLTFAGIVTQNDFRTDVVFYNKHYIFLKGQMENKDIALIFTSNMELSDNIQSTNFRTSDPVSDTNCAVVAFTSESVNESNMDKNDNKLHYFELMFSSIKKSDFDYEVAVPSNATYLWLGALGGPLVCFGSVVGIATHVDKETLFYVSAAKYLRAIDAALHPVKNIYERTIVEENNGTLLCADKLDIPFGGSMDCMFLSYVFVLVGVSLSTIDLNLPELQYVADHLKKEECRKLVAALHDPSFDIVNNIDAAERKIPTDISCLKLLLHWNSQADEGKGETHVVLTHRLRQLGHEALADWLSRTVFHELGQDLNRSLLSDPFKETAPVTENSSIEYLTTTEEEVEYHTETIMLWIVILGGLSILLCICFVLFSGYTAICTRKKKNRQKHKEGRGSLSEEQNANLSDDSDSDVPFIKPNTKK